jgi:GNAT superfamily N-acetyltransferase
VGDTQPAPPAPITLRAARTADAPAVAEVLIASRRAFMPYAPSAHSDDAVRAWVRDTLVPTGCVIVAERDGEIAGVLAHSDDGTHRWIDQMFVRPTHVGQGIGTRLLNHARSVLAPPLRLYTFQANHGARRFYERHGFRAIAFSDGRGNEERCPDVLYETAQAT